MGLVVHLVVVAVLAGVGWVVRGALLAATLLLG